MAAHKRGATLDKAHLPRSLGLFTPTGHIVMGFASDADMTKARKALLQEGFARNTIAAFLSSEVVAEIQKVRPKFSKVAFLFHERNMMRDHLELARQRRRVSSGIRTVKNRNGARGQDSQEVSTKACPQIQPAYRSNRQVVVEGAAIN